MRLSPLSNLLILKNGPNSISYHYYEHTAKKKEYTFIIYENYSPSNCIVPFAVWYQNTASLVVYFQLKPLRFYRPQVVLFLSFSPWFSLLRRPWSFGIITAAGTRFVSWCFVFYLRDWSY